MVGEDLVGNEGFTLSRSSVYRFRAVFGRHHDLGMLAVGGDIVCLTRSDRSTVARS